MKSVRPGDAIENIIIQQISPLEGLGVKHHQLQKLLDTFGQRCLLILDGWYEIPRGAEGKILKIIKGQKLHCCNILFTSRPHGTGQIGEYFSDKVLILGFESINVKAFITKVLKDEKKSKMALKFAMKHILHERRPASPLLLLFICILIDYGELSPSMQTVRPGDIYARLVRCLYKRYTSHHGIDYDVKGFIEVLLKVGRLSFQTLLSGKTSFQREQVLTEVGVDAFEYSYIIGYQDFNLFFDETMDICLTFCHRTIQEFLVSFYVIRMIDDDENFELTEQVVMKYSSIAECLISLLGKEFIFLESPLFLLLYVVLI